MVLLSVRALVLSAALAHLAAAKTDIAGCVSTATTNAYGEASMLWYVQNSCEICDIPDCGGGMAPPITTNPACANYQGTATYSPSFFNCNKAAAAPTTTATSASSSAAGSSSPAPTSTASSSSSSSSSAAVGAAGITSSASSMSISTTTAANGSALSSPITTGPVSSLTQAVVPVNNATIQTVPGTSSNAAGLMSTFSLANTGGISSATSSAGGASASSSSSSSSSGAFALEVQIAGVMAAAVMAGIALL